MPFKPGDIVRNTTHGYDIFLILDPKNRHALRLGSFGGGLKKDAIEYTPGGYYPSESNHKLVNILNVLEEVINEK